VILRPALVTTAVCALALVESAPRVIAQAPAASGIHAPLDQLLELYVRDGLVYYNAVKSDRRRLDGYVAALNGPQARAIDRAPDDEQVAFWLNAYNALVLQTVINNYPIRGRSSNYPPNSVRQIAGAFDRTPHTVAGRPLTLDQIETEVLARFRDPRLYLAVGRGAVGGGRLRSEAYNGATLGQQLAAVAAEFATGGHLLDIDEATGVVTVTPILSWRQADFVAAYASAAPPRYAERSPIEKALLAFIHPNMLPHEREFLEKNQFRVQFAPFDWRLNDLSGGRP
jgi:Protein of unknown function, DUF547